MRRKMAAISPQARAWLLTEVQYLAERNLQAAEALVERMRLLRERLADFPNSGVRGSIQGTRRLTLKPYVVIARVGNGRVEIISIRHSRQRDAHEPAENRDPDMRSDPAGDDIGLG